MSWYVIHTKPKKEQCALLNLQRQGYECFLPMRITEKLHRGALAIISEPLFPRYLFINLDATGSGKGWRSIRSTVGVSQIVTFGNNPARMTDRLVDLLRSRSDKDIFRPQRMFMPGERLEIKEGSFVGIEAIYQMDDGKSRVTVLVELLNTTTKLIVSPAVLRRIE